MADIGSELDAGPYPGATPNPSPEQVQQHTDAWSQFLAQPGNRAAVMQMGLQLMQPISPGQTPLGAAGVAIGAGAEAAQHSDEIAQAEENRQSKLALQSAQAQSLTDRGEAALTRANTPKGSGGALTLKDRIRIARNEAKAVDDEIKANAKQIYKDANDPLNQDPNVAQYKGLNPTQIANKLASDKAFVQSIRDRRKATGAVGSEVDPSMEEGADPSILAPMEPQAPGVAAPTASAAPLPAASDVISQYGAQWNKLRTQITSTNPAEQQRAQLVLNQLKQRVRDPQTFDRLLKGQ